MGFARPSLRTLIGRVGSDLEGALTGVSAKLRRSNVKVLSKTLAGAVHGLYGYIAFVASNILPDKAQDEYLDRWGKIWVGDRLAAQAASGSGIWSGADGTVVAINKVVQRTDGLQYRITAEGTVAAGTVTLALEALEGGRDWNAEEGEPLTFIEPIIGLDAGGYADVGGFQGGANKEGNESYQIRIIERIQEPPQGGAHHDYIAWAKSVSGVTRVWVYEHWMGLGTVGVTFVLDEDVDPIPNQAKIDEVSAAIEADRTVTAEIWVFAPIIKMLNPEISLNPDTSETREAVTAQLKDLVRRESEPGSLMPRTHIAEAISTAEGEFDHLLTSPSADVQSAPGELLQLGEIAWL